MTIVLLIGALVLLGIGSLLEAARPWNEHPLYGAVTAAGVALTVPVVVVLAVRTTVLITGG